MKIIPLRRFLYLDNQIVNNYLSIVDGGLSDGPTLMKETSESTKKGEAGISLPPVQIGGGIGGKSTTELQRTVIETDASKFERLYENLSASNGVVYIECADDGEWSNLQRQTIVEVVGRIRLLDWEQVLEVVNQLTPLVDVMEQFGQTVDNATKAMFSGIKQLGAASSGKATTVILEVLESPKFRFVTSLAEQMILVPKADLEGEVTILGSIQRKLKPGEKLSISSLLPSTSALVPLNRAQRRAPKPKVKTAAPNPLLQEVAAPACTLTAVAVFK